MAFDIEKYRYQDSEYFTDDASSECVSIAITNDLAAHIYKEDTVALAKHFGLFDDKYLSEHHAITETAIGAARLMLEEGNPDEAARWLDEACAKIDQITIKYRPRMAKLMEPTNEQN